MTQEHAKRRTRHAAAGALSAVRAHLEHQAIRAPFGADICNVLEALAAAWGGSWDIGHVNGQWRAQRRDGTGLLLTCETPDELVRAMRGWGGR